MKSFKWIHQHALEHVGPELEAYMPRVLDKESLAEVPDDRLFSVMTRRIFRAGLKHSVVDARWPEFEKAFWGFDPEKISLMSDEQLESLMQNEAIIRHWGKIKATRVNAMLVSDLSRRHAGFGRFLADWPDDELVELWALLKKQGSQLGGRSAAMFLRMVGRDTFVLTPDVVAALKALEVIDKEPTAKRDLKQVQAAFNQWQQESGRPLAHISQLLAFTVGWR